MNLVEVTFFDGASMGQVPLIVVMLVTFVLGTLFGFLITLPSTLRRRSELNRARKELDRIQAIVAQQGAGQGGLVHNRDGATEHVGVTPL